MSTVPRAFPKEFREDVIRVFRSSDSSIAQADPITDAQWVQAHRANALFDVHCDDPEFGYRFLVDEARGQGQVMADRTGWRICSANGWFSVFGKAARPGTPAHEDHVRRNFTAAQPNQLWLTDITEHATGEGKLCLWSGFGVSALSLPPPDRPGKEGGRHPKTVRTRTTRTIRVD